MRLFLDTSVMIDYERSFLKLRNLGDVKVPAMAVAEFVRGIEQTNDRQIRNRGERFLARQIAPLGIVDFGFEAARAWAALVETLRRAGLTMKFGDSLIAAQCLSENASLVTADGDFDRVPGLTIIAIEKMNPS